METNTYKYIKFLLIMSVNYNKYSWNCDRKLLNCDKGGMHIQVRIIHLYNKFIFSYLRIVILNTTKILLKIFNGEC